VVPLEEVEQKELRGQLECGWNKSQFPTTNRRINLINLVASVLPVSRSTSLYCIFRWFCLVYNVCFVLSRIAISQLAVALHLEWRHPATPVWTTPRMPCTDLC